MSKLTLPQREQLNKFIVDCIVQRFSLLEAQGYVKDKLGIDISIDYINELKVKIKKSAKKQLEYLQRDRFEFVKCAFFDRKAELESQQQMLQDIIRNNIDKPSVQIQAIHELHSLSNSIYQLYALLPTLTSIKIINNDNPPPHSLEVEGKIIVDNDNNKS